MLVAKYAREGKMAYSCFFILVNNFIIFNFISGSQSSGPERQVVSCQETVKRLTFLTQVEIAAEFDAK